MLRSSTHVANIFDSTEKLADKIEYSRNCTHYNILKEDQVFLNFLIILTERQVTFVDIEDILKIYQC